MESHVPQAPSLPSFSSTNTATKCFNTTSMHFAPLHLHFAINAGNVDAVRNQIAEGTDLNFTAPTNGQTPLTLSIQTQQYEIALLLLSAGADASLSEHADWRRQPIHFASAAGHTELVSAILDQVPCSVEATDSMHFTPLHYAAIAGKLGVVKLLLERGASAAVSDDRGRTPLFRAVEQQHIDVVDVLLSAGAAINCTDVFGWMPIYQSAVCGHLNVVKCLLERGAYVNGGGFNKLRPLHVACGLMTFDMAMAVLHDTGYDYYMRRSNATTPCVHHTVAAAHSSDYQNNIDMVDLLIDFGADVNKRNGQCASPLKCAVYAGRPIIIRLLVSAGANIRREKWLLDPDHRAVVKFADQELIEWLRRLAFVSVPPLMQMCRLAIRRALQPGTRNKIAELPIPTLLKQYLQI